MKSVADRVQKKLLIRDLVNGFDFLVRQSQGQHAVVRADKPVVGSLHRDRRTRAARAVSDLVGSRKNRGRAGDEDRNGRVDQLITRVATDRLNIPKYPR